MLVRFGDGLVAFEVEEDSTLGYAARLNSLKRQAAEKLADYPQYDGYHDGDEWVLIRVKRAVRTKLGLAFEKGEVALAKFLPVDPAEHQEVEAWNAWSVANGVHTHVPVVWAEQMKPVLA